MDTELVRIATTGSVDDGKSTLIGRLLHDTKQIFVDQLAAIESASARRGDGQLDLALLTDGLRAEREQGITIDVAYRYFATPKRKFVLADTPGHVQYTRNMVTGASTADIALVLVDARLGVLEQTRRHAFIASLLGVPHMVVCVNKMDLVEYAQEVYDAVVEDFSDFASRLNIGDLRFVPISALEGDNVVDRSNRMPWYDGMPVLRLLEEIHIASDRNLIDCRFPVQYVVRSQTRDSADYRGYAGRIAGGVFKSGDEVVALPSGFKSKVASIDTFDGPLDEASAPRSVTIRLDDDIDISRGDMICRVHNQPTVGQDVEALVCWLSEDMDLQIGRRYHLKHTTRWVKALASAVRYELDVNSLHRNEEAESLSLNEIGRVRLRLTQPIFYDTYQQNRETGSFILIDEASYRTVGAGMIVTNTP